MDIMVPKQAIEHFDKWFKGTRHCSPNFTYYNILKLHVDFEAFKREDWKHKRKLEIMRASEFP